MKVLQDNPEWLDTLRGVIISKEISDVPGSLEELKATVDRMNTTVSDRLDNVSSTLTTVSGRLENLTGSDYEGQAAHFGRRRLRDTLQVNNVQLMYQHRRQGEEHLRNLLFQAATHHGLSRENQDELEETDLIFWVYGSSPESQSLVTAHLVAEVSITIKATDVARARRRDQILGSCKTIPCLAAVIGTAITPEAKNHLGEDVTAVGMTSQPWA